MGVNRFIYCNRCAVNIMVPLRMADPPPRGAEGSVRHGGWHSATRRETATLFRKQKVQLMRPSPEEATIEVARQANLLITRHADGLLWITMSRPFVSLRTKNHASISSVGRLNG